MGKEQAKSRPNITAIYQALYRDYRFRDRNGAPIMPDPRTRPGFAVLREHWDKGRKLKQRTPKK